MREAIRTFSTRWYAGMLMLPLHPPADFGVDAVAPVLSFLRRDFSILRVVIESASFTLIAARPSVSVINSGCQ